jgi:putative ABC transport system permease protein
MRTEPCFYWQEPSDYSVAGTGLDQPVHSLATTEQIIGGSLAERRLVLQMLGIFGGLALALASVGIAGVVSYTMSRRLREIAIRIALSARPQQVLGLAMDQGMTMVALGVGVGLAAWFALMQIISSWLYKVTPTDPVTLAGVAVMLSAVTLAATYLPAHRSLCVDPVDVLRYQ